MHPRLKKHKSIYVIHTILFYEDTLRCKILIHIICFDVDEQQKNEIQINIITNHLGLDVIPQI